MKNIRNKVVLKYKDEIKLIVFEETTNLQNGLSTTNLEVCLPSCKEILNLDSKLKRVDTFLGLNVFSKSSYVVEPFQNGFVVNEHVNLIFKNGAERQNVKHECLSDATFYDYSGNVLATVKNRDKLTEEDINCIIDSGIKRNGGRNF